MTKPVGERLRHQLMSALSTEVLSFGMAFLFSVATTRALMPEGKGIYSSVVALVGITTSIASFGVSKATIQVANRAGTNARDVYAAVWWMTIPMCLSASLVVLLILPSGIGPGVLATAVGMSCAFIVAGNLEGMLRSKQRTLAINASALVQAAVPLTIVGVHVFRHAGAMTATDVLGLSLLGWGARVLVLAAAYARLDAWPSRTSLRTLPWKDLVVFGAGYQVYAITWSLHMRQDLSMAPYLCSATEVGLYATAAGLAQMLWRVPTAVGSVVLPRLAEVQGDKRSAGMTAIATRWSFTAVAIPAVVLGIVSPYLLGLLYGPEFVAAAAPMRVLLPGVVAGAVYLVAAGNLVARGQLRPLILIGVVCTGSNAILNLVLQPSYGGIGAAIASCITYTASAFAVIWVVMRDSGLPLRAFLIVQPEDIRRLLKRAA